MPFSSFLLLLFFGGANSLYAGSMLYWTYELFLALTACIWDRRLDCEILHTFYELARMDGQNQVPINYTILSNIVEKTCCNTRIVIVDTRCPIPSLPSIFK